MNSRIERMRATIIDKVHHAFRQPTDQEELDGISRYFCDEQIPDIIRAQRRLSWVLQKEVPVIFPEEKIVFTKTVQKIPELFSQAEWEKIRETHHIHEMGRVCNISSDYEYTIAVGLNRRKEEIEEAKVRQEGNPDAQLFLNAVLQSIYDIEDLVNRYALEAMKIGREDIYDILRRIPANGAGTFHEALQFFRILHFTLWAGGNYHNTVGRFDQYMIKYLERDLELGILTEESALELLEEFFITFNKDSDLYPGMQQGDNGQSLVLGGVDKEGNDAFNLLSDLSMKASLNLKLIDPKINLRVTKNTSLAQFERATELTKEGLGFPQYSNDEVVIPGLVNRGYELEDARNYVVAACWEFIIPGVGMDIPNIDALSFTKVIENSIYKHLDSCESFDDFMEKVKFETGNELQIIYNRIRRPYFEPAPFQSLLMNDTISQARDISLGSKYNNYGIHGTGIATVVDSLAAIKKFVFEEKYLAANELIAILKCNYSGFDEVWEKMKYEAPKYGNDDDYVDSIAVQLVENFYELIKDRKNDLGGCFRPGAGSAMYYLWHIKDAGATPDGRKKGEPLSANFSPALNVKLNGPVSIIKSFSKPDMTKIINGGPLTLELHDTVFRNKDAISKVASLVKAYMDLGGQQLQINAVNRDRLIEAKKHPELHKNLIVRVWGWSGYFVELDEEYQDHIIQRVELQL
jgi:pyruvate-formate lyase